MSSFVTPTSLGRTSRRDAEAGRSGLMEDREAEGEVEAGAECKVKPGVVILFAIL